MKKIHLYIMVSAIAGIMLSSCVSMDMSPKSQGNSESWYSTELELEMACNRFYTIGYWNDPEESMEQWTDNFTYRNTNRHPSEGAPLDGNLDGYDGIVVSLWEKAYRLIAQANLVLQHSHRAVENGVNEDVVNQYRAEAYFARACKYAELISLYGDVPYMEKEVTISEAEAMERVPVEELRPLVYSDFDHAIDSLPVSYSGTQRFTKGAALAMKARFALYQADWETAASAAKECMDLGIYSLEPDYTNIFLTNTREIPEKIFIIPRSVTYDVVLDVWFVNNELPRNVGGYGSSTPSWDLLACYLCTDGLPIDESDLFNPRNPFENRDPRCTKTIVEFNTLHCGWYYEPTALTATSATGATKTNQDCRLNQQYCSYNALIWKKGVDDSWLDDTGSNKGSVDPDYIIMRYADVLLMYAEAKIEMDDIDDSVLNAINSVRARAYGVDVSATSAYPAVTVTTQDELRRTLRLERRVELAKENLRYMDVIRWGIYDKAFNGYNYILPENDGIEVMIDSGQWLWGDICPQLDEDGMADFSPLVSAGLARLGAQRVFPDHQALWPIPTYERLLCPNLTQNPGY